MRPPLPRVFHPPQRAVRDRPPPVDALRYVRLRAATAYRLASWSGGAARRSDRTGPGEQPAVPRLRQQGGTGVAPVVARRCGG